jgi:hypothetical protein
MMLVKRLGNHPPFPRRNCLDLQTPAEAAIRSALIAVEAIGVDPRLTDGRRVFRGAGDRGRDRSRGQLGRLSDRGALDHRRRHRRRLLGRQFPEIAVLTWADARATRKIRPRWAIRENAKPKPSGDRRGRAPGETAGAAAIR